MNAIGGQELHLTALQDKQKWEPTNRWSDESVDTWFKTKLRSGSELGLGFTHEEPLTSLMKDHISSFRDLPVYPYQFQTKFRNEERAKSGILRGREFLMKDLYSFSTDQKEHDEFYEKATRAYQNVFNRVGLNTTKVRTYKTFASGGSFAKYSHEFQTVSDAGEDTIYVHKEKDIAINKEVMNDDVLNDLGIKREDLVEKKSIEVGNIFSLGTRFSEALGLNYKDMEGKPQPVVMGSYGIGPSRVMGTIAELWSDDKGLDWPESVAPFSTHLIALFDRDGKVKQAADKIYEKLIKDGVEVLYDDRDVSAGEKFSDSDLIGIPSRIILSERTLAKNEVEQKFRYDDAVKMIPISQL